MSEIKTGGSAFPRGELHDEYPRPGAVECRHLHAEEGMTLRDHFAAKVAPAIYADLTMKLLESGKLVENVYEIVAIASYEMADSMLRARGE
jgi:hypothetical protein